MTVEIGVDKGRVLGVRLKSVDAMHLIRMVKGVEPDPIPIYALDR